MIYILQHTINKEVLAVFDDKERAEIWQKVVNYSTIIEMDITDPLSNKEILNHIKQS